MWLPSIQEVLSRAGVTVDETRARALAEYAGYLWRGRTALDLVGYVSPAELLSLGLEDAVQAFRLASPKGTVVDVGSGGGLPGLVWAILGEDLSMTLLESERRKVFFLRRTVEALGVGAEVMMGRAEEEGRGRLREVFQGAVARAVAPPLASVELTVPLVAVGGSIWLLRTGEEPPEAARAHAELLGAEWRGRTLYRLAGERQRAVWAFQKVRATPADFPRRFARIRREAWR